jgi:arylsulfatase A
VGDWGAFGSPNTQTPAINRIAEQGAKLTQFHTQPLCSPSRAALLTGRLPVRTGVYTNESYPLDMIFRVFFPISVGCLPGSETTLPEWHRNATGAFSALIGKYHCGSNVAANCTPTQNGGFDYYFGLLNSHEEGFPGPFPESIVFPPMSLHENLHIVEQPTNLYDLTPRYTQRAMQLIEMIATGNATTPNPRGLGDISPRPFRGQPFSLFVHYEESHVPLFASPGYQNTSVRGDYGDMTGQMDGSVAVIVDHLTRYNLLNDTLIVITSDNGAWIDPSDGLPGASGKAQDGGSNGPMKVRVVEPMVHGVSRRFAGWKGIDMAGGDGEPCHCVCSRAHSRRPGGLHAHDHHGRAPHLCRGSGSPSASSGLGRT